jgi:hypothetical protein
MIHVVCGVVRVGEKEKERTERDLFASHHQESQKRRPGRVLFPE